MLSPLHRRFHTRYTVTHLVLFFLVIYLEDPFISLYKDFSYSFYDA